MWMAIFIFDALLTFDVVLASLKEHWNPTHRTSEAQLRPCVKKPESEPESETEISIKKPAAKRKTPTVKRSKRLAAKRSRRKHE